MECGFCKRKLEASLVAVGPGYQVSCTCECGAVWTYDIYSLSCMALVEGPTGLDQAIFDGAEPILAYGVEWPSSLKHPAN